MIENFSVYIPLLSAIFVLILTLFIFLKGKKTRVQFLFFLISCFFINWFFATFKMLTSQTEVEILFWDRINYITAIFEPILFYHFGLEFTNLYNKPRKRLLIGGYVLALIFLLISRTNYFVNGVYRYSWRGHAKAAIAHHPFMVYFIFYMILFFFILYEGYKKTRKEPIKNTQIKYLLLGFGLFSIIASPAFLPAYGISVYPFEYIAGVIFVIITAVGITRHFLFGIRVILTEFLVGVMWLTLFILPFLIEPFKVRMISIGIFSLSLIFGWLLIRATHQEIKRREEIEKLYEELKKIDIAKSEFISIASHQLRTPLSAIKGYLSMILEGSYGKLPEKVKKPMENVFVSNERLIKLVNDILSVSKIEAGEMEMNWEKEDLRETIKEVISELSIKAKEKNLYLNFEEPKEFPKILLDREKIRQVILNLVDNAIRYTQKGGVTVKLQIVNGRLQIVVSDTGEGLTKEEKEKLFERFSRGTAGLRFWTQGAGLGLYIARKFVEMHKGKIWAESEGRGKGSTFYVELPMK